MDQIVETRPTSQCWRILQKNVDLDLYADDFTNLITSSLYSDTSVVKLHKDPFSSFYVKLLTDRQTYKHQALHNFGGGNNY